MLVVDERDAPFAVEVHRELPCLEGLRRRELVDRLCLEAYELVVAVPVDEALVPVGPFRPRRIGADQRVTLRVDPLATPLLDPAVRCVLVEADDGVEAGDLDVALRVADGQLLRVRCELGHRLRRALDPRLREHRLVVVEAVVVGEQRQRAPLALVLRVVPRRRREDRRVDVVFLEQRRRGRPSRPSRSSCRRCRS